MSQFNTVSEVTGGFPGSAPRIKTADTANSLATITAAGYMNDQVAAGNTSIDDLWYVNYAVGGAEGVGLFTVTYSNPNYSLTTFNSGFTGSSSVSGHFAMFSNSTGGIDDSLAIARSGPYSTVVMATLGSVVGATPTYADTGGSLGAGYNLGFHKATGPGGSAAFTVPDATVTTSSYILFQFSSVTNNGSVLVLAGPNAGSIGVICTGDPGAWAANYIVINT